MSCFARHLIKLDVECRTYSTRHSVGWNIFGNLLFPLRPHLHYAGWFENGGFTLKTHQLLKRNNHRSLWFCFWESSVREITIIVRPSFSKFLFSKCFPSTRQWKTGVFKSPLFQERFRKSLFSWRISVDGRPNLTLRFQVSPAQCERYLKQHFQFVSFLVLFFFPF